MICDLAAICAMLAHFILHLQAKFLELLLVLLRINCEALVHQESKIRSRTSLNQYKVALVSQVEGEANSNSQRNDHVKVE